MKTLWTICSIALFLSLSACSPSTWKVTSDKITAHTYSKDPKETPEDLEQKDSQPQAEPQQKSNTEAQEPKKEEVQPEEHKQVTQPEEHKQVTQPEEHKQVTQPQVTESQPKLQQEPKPKEESKDADIVAKERQEPNTEKKQIEYIQKPRLKLSKEEYQKKEAYEFYEITGKPKFQYSKGLKEKFQEKLNHGINLKSLSRKDQEKWTKIYTELKRVAHVQAGIDPKLLFTDKKTAEEKMIRFEKYGETSETGAYTIAVDSVAKKYGFSDRPCAEFMTEIIRQAYKRSDIELSDDFNSQNHNSELTRPTGTAAVANLTKALVKAGWVVWDAAEYKPMIGAIMMHQYGQSPGHTYLSASDDGLIVIDNGSPKSRDLRLSSAKVIAEQFKTGPFFLPPGVNPDKW